MVKCSICGKDENSLLRVKHRKLGTINLCFECWEVESSNKNLLPSCSRCDCCKWVYFQIYCNLLSLFFTLQFPPDPCWFYSL